MSEIIFMVLYFSAIALCIATPVLTVIAFVYFIINLISLISAKKKNKANPETVPAEKISVIIKKLIISAAIFVVLIAVIVSVVVLFSMSIAYM